MTKLEEFTQMKKQLEFLRKSYWSFDLTRLLDNVSVYTDGGPDGRLIDSARKQMDFMVHLPELCISEYQGSNLMFHCAGALGEAVRQVLVRRLEKALNRLAKEAADEAQECLDEIKKGANV